MSTKSTKIEYSVEQLTRCLRRLETEIQTWGARNSQSNPGAVMELREMRKQRDVVGRALALAMAQEKAKDAAA
jgi:hypothetical protein